MLQPVRRPAAQRPTTPDAQVSRAHSPGGHVSPRTAAIVTAGFPIRIAPPFQLATNPRPFVTNRSRAQVVIGSVFAKKNERPVGVPAARGHGVMEVQTFEALGGGLEYIPRVPLGSGAVDRPLGSFHPGTNVPPAHFAAPSL